jgi:UDP-GlcNAc3NAcA epimerase
VAERIVTVVGARPQFVKAAVVSRALARVGLTEILIHTGQHYDAGLSDVFFDTLRIPAPVHSLGVGSGPHGQQTGRMLEALEPVLQRERPGFVLVYGDTNSTLAGALCAAKVAIRVAHVEAGLRSFNRRMPEEINRVLTDHIADVLFAPTDAAVANLAAEGICRGVVRTGDVMYDAALLFRDEMARGAADLPARFGVEPHHYAIATVHRAENTDDSVRWRAICEGLRKIASRGLPVLFPVHPRVRHQVHGISAPGLHLLPPLPYFDMQGLLMHACVALTDSGGLQKEAAFHGVPCVTLRNETEWVELVDNGLNWLAGADAERIAELALWAANKTVSLPAQLYGDGHAADRVAATLLARLA